MKAVPVIAITSLLLGCQPSADEGKRLMDLYTSDKQARDLVIEECKRNAGLARKELECVVATEALRQDSIGSFKDLPPLDLQLPSEQQSSAQRY